MRPGFSGPLGDRIVAGPGSGQRVSGSGVSGSGAPDPGPAAAAPPEGAAGGTGFGRGLSDPFSVQIFNHLMQAGTARTALVFMDAEETLRHIEAVRGLAGFFAHQVSYRRKRRTPACWSSAGPPSTTSASSSPRSARPGAGGGRGPADRAAQPAGPDRPSR